jgi:hypothetical protein
VKVSWTTEVEDKVKMLYVERSTDGAHFMEIAKVQPQGGRHISKNYEVIDRNPVEGNNYYRLKELDTDGQYHYLLYDQIDPVQ